MIVNISYITILKIKYILISAEKLAWFQRKAMIIKFNKDLERLGSEVMC